MRRGEKMRSSFLRYSLDIDGGNHFRSFREELKEAFGEHKQDVDDTHDLEATASRIKDSSSIDDNSSEMEENGIVDVDKKSDSKLGNFLKNLNLIVLIAGIWILTLICCLCFKSLAFKIIILVETVIALVFALYITYDSDDSDEELPIFVNDKLHDGFELILPNESTIKLADLVVQAPVNELKDLHDYLVNPANFDAIGYKPETRILIFGDAGSGKNTLIRAFANDTDLPIIKIHASRFFTTPEAFEKIFKIAEQIPRYIIQIDAINLLYEQASSASESSDTVLDTLKTYLDVYKNVILFATSEEDSILVSNDSITNYFKKIILIEMPDQDERISLMKEFTSNLAINEEVDFARISKNLIGFSISEIKYIVANAISNAMKNGRVEITQSDFFEAMDSIEYGSSIEKNSEENQQIVAYHEGGHALVAYLLRGAKGVLRVVSTSRGNHGGFTSIAPDFDKLVYSKDDLIDEVCIHYAGRCAEKIIFGHISTGASSDIQQATSIISSMVQKFGMSDAIGPLDVSPKLALMTVLYESDDMRNLISQECIRLGRECEERTLNILQDNREKLDILAQYLIDHESITGDEIEKLFENK